MSQGGRSVLCHVRLPLVPDVELTLEVSGGPGMSMDSVRGVNSKKVNRAGWEVGGTVPGGTEGPTYSSRGSDQGHGDMQEEIRTQETDLETRQGKKQEDPELSFFHS